jgi:CRP/FNR family transcriptional regulator, cyclic AMP receptor protein
MLCTVSISAWSGYKFDREAAFCFLFLAAQVLRIASPIFFLAAALILLLPGGLPFLQNAFEHDPFLVVIWTDGVFRASQYSIESLEKELDQSDFAIAIAQPDDITESRDKSARTPRDNVIFELGFFMGRLGRHRSLLLEPRGEEVKLPSDLTGITTIPYKYDANNLAAALGPACNRVRDVVNELGPNN